MGGAGAGPDPQAFVAASKDRSWDDSVSSREHGERDRSGLDSALGLAGDAGMRDTGLTSRGEGLVP